LHDPSEEGFGIIRSILRPKLQVFRADYESASVPEVPPSTASARGAKSTDEGMATSTCSSRKEEIDPLKCPVDFAPRGIRIDYIQPGKLQHKAYVEQFNRMVRNDSSSNVVRLDQRGAGRGHPLALDVKQRKTEHVPRQLHA